jgi:4-amino-4-deoxychorismate mutase
MTEPELNAFRERIDALDATLVELLAHRLEVCREVARWKRAHGIPMMQPERVEAVKHRCAELGVARGLDADFMRSLYGLIIDHACALEDEIIDAKEARPR